MRLSDTLATLDRRLAMRACIIITLICLCSPAWGQDAPTHRAELIAWSSDGASALISEVVTNPDGSGERAIRLLSKRSPKRVVLSKIANANAKKPQKVSERSCIQRMKGLKATVDKRGFSDLTFDLNCADRANLVTAGEALKAKTADTWFSGEGLALDRGSLELSLKDNVLVLASQGSPVASWANTPQPLQLKAAMASTGRLVIILFGWGSGNWRVMKALDSKDGDPKGLKSIRI